MRSIDSASFIFSLDCEGKWGMADAITNEHRRNFTTDRLWRVYRDLLDLLSSLDLSATFAFVGAFTLSPEQYDRYADRIAGSPAVQAWLRHFEQDRRARNVEGWFLPGVLDAVRNRGHHEIASHGFVHLPLHEKTSAADAEREIQTAVEVARSQGWSPETFIYPRNSVGHVDLLRKYGFVAYRDGFHKKRGKLDQIRSIAAELNLAGKGQPHVSNDSYPLCLPSGYFLNWRWGARRLIPIPATVARWKAIVDDSIRNGRVAHAWMHPHNLLYGDRQLELLENILTYVARRVRAGDLHNMTQLEYTRRRDQAQSSVAS
jgi:Polysaccharide deacetylase